MNLASRRISKMRLRSKLLWSYLIANILVFVLGIVGLSVMTQSSTDKAIDDVQGNFEETCLMFSNRMNLNYMVLDIVYSDQYFIRQLQREYSSVSDYFTGYFELILGTVSRKNIMLSDNTRVEIFGDNPTIVYDGYILRKLDSKVKNQPWYDSVIAG